MKANYKDLLLSVMVTNQVQHYNRIASSHSVHESVGCNLHDQEAPSATKPVGTTRIIPSKKDRKVKRT